MCICIDRFLNSINFLRRFQHKCQSFKWTRFEIIATLHCSLPRWFSIQAYIGFHVVDIINRRSLFIPLGYLQEIRLKVRSYLSWSAILNVQHLSNLIGQYLTQLVVEL